MKKVLVIGAGGTIGSELIKYLLSEGMYNITVLDLKNSNVNDKLKKYRKRVTIILSDACDRVLVESLVKDHDYVINLATCLPPFGVVKKNLTKSIEFDIVENICRAISYYNPNCHFINASSTSVYTNDGNEKNIKSETSYVMHDYYSQFKLKSEKLIKEKTKKYTIVRVPMILDSNPHNPFIMTVKLSDTVNCITKEDAAYALCKILSKEKELNKKIVNLNGGEGFTLKYSELFGKMLKYRGFSLDIIAIKLFFEKNYHSPVCTDSSKMNELLDYQNDTIDNYFSRLKYRSRYRKVNILIGKLISKIRKY